MFYVTVDGNNSILYKLLMDMVQGLILKPVLYALLVLPLFNLEELFAFADNIIVARKGSVKQVMIDDFIVYIFQSFHLSILMDTPYSKRKTLHSINRHSVQ